MRYELEGIDLLVKNQITPEKLTLNRPPELQLQEWLMFLEAEKTKIFRIFLTEIYELKPTDRVESYIQLHQASLTSLMDTVHLYCSEASTNDLKLFYTKISSIIDSIAIFIQEYLNKYIDHDFPVPLSYNKRLQEKMRVALGQMKEYFRGTDVELSLLNIIMHPINGFLDNPQKINFRKAHYFQEVTQEIIALPKFYLGGDLVKRLHELLHSFNFNTPEYVHYCMITLERKLKEKENTQARIELLEWYIKNINQLPLKVGFVLIPNLPSVCDQMLIWIKEEYQYLLAHSISDVKVPPKINGIKIRTNFSVPQLAALARTMIEKGAITNETNIEVLRFFAHYVTTINSEDISEESLKNKFYNIEPGTIGQMKDWFTGFIQVLDEL